MSFYADEVGAPQAAGPGISCIHTDVLCVLHGVLIPQQQCGAALLSQPCMLQLLAAVYPGQAGRWARITPAVHGSRMPHACATF
jgi:hypothetical protein